MKRELSTSNIWKYLSKLFNRPIIEVKHLYDVLLGYEWVTKYPEYGIILGGMPRQKFLDENKDDIVGIVNLCDENISYNPVETLYLPTIDSFEPSIEYLWEAVNFIENKTRLNYESEHKKYIYIHCRAGIGRSATVSVAWLCYKFKVTPEHAFTSLRGKRPQINENCYVRSNITKFYEDIKKMCIN